MVDFAQLGPELLRLAKEKDVRFRDGYLFAPVRTRDGFHTHHYVLKYTLRDWVKAKFRNELFSVVKASCAQETNPFSSRYLSRLVESFANAYSTCSIVPNLTPLLINVVLVSYANGIYNKVTQEIVPYSVIDVEHELYTCMTSAYVHLMVSPAAVKLPVDLNAQKQGTWKSQKILDLSKIVIGAPIKSKCGTASAPLTVGGTSVVVECKENAEDTYVIPFFRPCQNVTRMTMRDLQEQIDGPTKVVVCTDSTSRNTEKTQDVYPLVPNSVYGNIGAETTSYLPSCAMRFDRMCVYSNQELGSSRTNHDVDTTTGKDATRSSSDNKSDS